MLLLALSLALAASSTVASAGRPALRIMPMGDSITQGRGWACDNVSFTPVEGGWRRHLGDLMHAAAAGSSIPPWTYVGSMFDAANHEGHR